MFRAAATAAVSMLSVVAGAWYIATPARTVLAVTMDMTTASRPAAGHEVIYTSARDAAGHAMRGVRVVLGRKTARGMRVMLSFTTTNKGTARKVMALPSGRYVIEVIVKHGRSTVTATKMVSMRRGGAYSLTIRERRSGGLFVLPLRAY
jgi:hypothetical protein